MNWVQACKGGPDATSNFEYSGPFTEAVVMGNLALRIPGEKLEWDGINMRFHQQRSGQCPGDAGLPTGLEHVIRPRVTLRWRPARITQVPDSGRQRAGTRQFA